MPGEIRKAIIRRIAEDRRIPIAAAAHTYACMSIKRRQEMCAREEARRSLPQDQDPAPSGSGEA